MAVVTTIKRNDGIANTVSGSFTGDGAAQILNLGFVPQQIIIFNETDAIRWEKLDQQVAANSIKTIGVGTMTLDATSAILFNVDGTVTLSAALAAAAKAIKFVARR